VVAAGGDFHEYLRAEVRPDLYSAADRFEWSGGWSDTARALGAADLRTWVDTRGLEGLDLFTHSHGGSVAMLASQGGLTIGELVMLSCPVHVQEYLPDFTRVSRAVSIRVHMDLIILVDGGGQKFQDPRIEEHVLPIWFDHFATHDPQVWRDHDVPSLL
jgi:pimeloyl-ACP methyl ester carboxylesterase